MSFVEKMREDLILVDVEGDTREEVMKNVAQVIMDKGIAKPTFYDALMQRENDYPTGLPIGELNCAIPHTYPEHINEVAITLAIPKKPVKFHQMGDPDVEIDVHVIICLTMLKMDDNVKQLPALMGFFANEENLRTLVGMKDPKEILEFIRANS